MQTDQSSTATHTLDRTSKKHGFNTGYLALCAHYEVEPTAIHVASPNENGDIESANGHLKRRLKNHLILRGSRDFASEAAYAEFVGQVCTGANLLRQAKVAEERPRLRPLPATRFPEAEEPCPFFCVRWASPRSAGTIPRPSPRPRPTTGFTRNAFLLI